MNIKAFFSSLAKIGISNIISLFSNVVISFLIPKLLGVEDYGAYKIFTLYVGYVSLLHIGFVDGIALKYSGMGYEQIDKKELKYNFCCFATIELIISLIVFSAGLFFFEGEQKYIAIFVALNITIINLTSYFQLLSQAVKHFNELAIRNTINAILQILSVVMLFCLQSRINVSYLSCILIFTFTRLILLIWYLITYRDNLCLPNISLYKQSKDNVIYLIRIGMPITWAAMISNLILSLDRQFVSTLFNRSEYGIYAFAYTLFGLTLTVVQSISTILYPMISSNKDEEYIKQLLPKMCGLIQIIAAFILAAYGPICLFIRMILSNYFESVSILRIIFPGVIMTCAVSVVGMSYYKYFGMGKLYFKYSFITLAVAFVSNLCAYIIFKKYEAIAYASILTLFIQYCLVYTKLASVTNTKWIMNGIYVLMILLIYYISSLFTPIINSFVYFFFFIIISAVFYKDIILRFIRMTKAK